MQLPETRQVTCPKCEAASTVPVPEADVELKTSPYKRAFGDYTKIECADGHIFWVYYC